MRTHAQTHTYARARGAAAAAHAAAAAAALVDNQKMCSSVELQHLEGFHGDVGDHDLEALVQELEIVELCELLGLDSALGPRFSIEYGWHIPSQRRPSRRSPLSFGGLGRGTCVGGVCRRSWCCVGIRRRVLPSTILWGKIR